MNRFAVIGASRGLGAELCRAIIANTPDARVLAVARKRERLEVLREELGDRVEIFPFDVTAEVDDLLGRLETFRPHSVYYMAGGGPFGPFQTKAWKDHLWAWNVSFLAAARIVHAGMKMPDLKRIILCGSSVAEAAGDPQAASYASAKHALFGLYRSLRLEIPEFDLRLYSPGYLDTELLPKNAPVRYKGVWNPKTVAADLWTWSCSNEHGGHRALPLHPD